MAIFHLYYTEDLGLIESFSHYRREIIQVLCCSQHSKRWKKKRNLWRKGELICGNKIRTTCPLWSVLSSAIGPYVEPSYATTDRGRIRGHKIKWPLLEVARGRRPYIMLSPKSERVLLEVAGNWAQWISYSLACKKEARKSSDLY